MCNGYRGVQNKTKSGETCMPWAAQNPHKHNYKPEGKHKEFDLIENYCRNPSFKKKSNKGLWCYTMNPKKRYENCDPLP
jgi:hypothetical protein